MRICVHQPLFSGFPIKFIARCNSVASSELPMLPLNPSRNCPTYPEPSSEPYLRAARDHPGAYLGKDPVACSFCTKKTSKWSQKSKALCFGGGESKPKLHFPLGGYHVCVDQGYGSRAWIARRYMEKRCGPRPLFYTLLFDLAVDSFSAYWLT